MPKRKPQKEITEYLSAGIGPDDNDNEDIDSNIDPEWTPGAPEVLEVEDDDADDDAASPKLKSSKKYKAREEIRDQRNERATKRKQTVQDQLSTVDILLQQAAAERFLSRSQSRSPTRSSLPDSPLPPGSGSDDSQMPTPISSSKRKKLVLFGTM